MNVEEILNGERLEARLVKQTCVDGVAPLHGELAGALPVGRVVLNVLKLLDALLEEVVRVVEVEGDAGAENVDEREALVVDGAHDELGESADVAAVPASNIGGAVHDG